MPRASIPSPTDATELVAPSIVEYGIHMSEGGWTQTAVSQLLEPVGESADEEAPAVLWWIGADQVPPALLQLRHRQAPQLGKMGSWVSAHVSVSPMRIG